MSGSKIKSAGQLKRILSGLKKRGKKIIFTNGCFDLLHYGHVNYLEEAKKKGDILVVGVNSDSSVRRIKGKTRPIVSECDRLRVIAALESVDFVTLFSDDTPLKLIKFLKPDILVKGSDWPKGKIIGADFVKNNGGRVLAIKLIKNRSTTNIIKKIGKAC